MSDSRTADLIRDLFFEQEVPVLATNYKHGIFRTVAVLVRSLLFSQRDPDIESPFASGSTVAIVYFPNELEAAHRASTGSLKIDRIIHLHPHRLSIIRATLGWTGMLRSAIIFVKTVLTLKGCAYVSRLTYPLLGWLLHETFVHRLRQASGVRIVTTNMQHPLSIGAAWAATDIGHSSIFYEHATTPRLVFKDRGYSDYFVHFLHTGRMIESFGIDAVRVHVQHLLPLEFLPRHQTPICRVGLCVNILDSLEAVEAAALVILAQGLKLSYRIHDADPRVKQLRRLAERHNAGWSNARETRIESYLETVDLVVVGNSNVIADAILAGCHVIYYWTGDDEMYDYYGLISHYQLPSSRDAGTLANAINKLRMGVTGSIRRVM